MFVRSEDNEADILTRNPTKQEFERHVSKWVSVVNGENIESEEKKED